MGNHISGLRNLTSETGFFPVKLVYRHCYDAAEILPLRSSMNAANIRPDLLCFSFFWVNNHTRNFLLFILLNC